MKYLIVIALIVLCCINSVHAQDTVQKKKIYRTWVSLNSEPFKSKGVLYEMKDSSILITSPSVIRDPSIGRSEVVQLYIDDIETIRTRKNNRVGKGILIGAVTGFAVGAMIGLISGDDPPCSGSFFCFHFTAGDKAILAGVPLSVAGAGIGALVGSIKVQIPINGSINNYNKNKDKLKEYTFLK